MDKKLVMKTLINETIGMLPEDIYWLTECAIELFMVIYFTDIKQKCIDYNIEMLIFMLTIFM